MAESLRGQLLIAAPSLHDYFRRTVVLVIEHTPEGAMGVVLNHESETRVADAVPQLAELAPRRRAGADRRAGLAASRCVAIGEFDDIAEAGTQVVGALGTLDPDAQQRVAAPNPRVRRLRRLGRGPARRRARAGGLGGDGTRARRPVQRRRHLVGRSGAQGRQLPAAGHDAGGPVAELDLAIRKRGARDRPSQRTNRRRAAAAQGRSSARCARLVNSRITRTVDRIWKSAALGVSAPIVPPATSSSTRSSWAGRREGPVAPPTRSRPRARPSTARSAAAHRRQPRGGPSEDLGREPAPQLRIVDHGPAEDAPRHRLQLRVAPALGLLHRAPGGGLAREQRALLDHVVEHARDRQRALDPPSVRRARARATVGPGKPTARTKGGWKPGGNETMR